jgi:hypothetical protein
MTKKPTFTEQSEQAFEGGPHIGHMFQYMPHGHHLEVLLRLDLFQAGHHVQGMVGDSLFARRGVRFHSLHQVSSAHQVGQELPGAAADVQDPSLGFVCGDQCVLLADGPLCERV